MATAEAAALAMEAATMATGGLKLPPSSFSKPVSIVFIFAVYRGGVRGGQFPVFCGNMLNFPAFRGFYFSFSSFRISSSMKEP